jgi:hypothetical protein
VELCWFLREGVTCWFLRMYCVRSKESRPAVTESRTASQQSQSFNAFYLLKSTISYYFYQSLLA